MINKRENEGISLITLIITIIVIIILASIAIFSGLATPDRASFAKFTTEISDCNLMVAQEYAKKSTNYAVNNVQKTKAQMYYELASGKVIGEDDEPVSNGNVTYLNNKLSNKLDGKEYYEITDETTITGWKLNKHYFSSDEKHYITDKGEMFILPGYRVEENGEEKWWINENKYYVGKMINIDNVGSDEENEDETTATYTVSFVNNGGSGVMSSIQKGNGDTYILPANSFAAPEGKKFDGWLVNGVRKSVGDTIEITGNLVIEPIWVDEKVMITFTIDGVEYQAEEGMSWERWFLSEYNTTGNTEVVIKESDNSDVSKSSTIEAGKSYVFIIGNLITLPISFNGYEGSITALENMTWEEIVGEGFTSYLDTPWGEPVEYTLEIAGENIICNRMAGPTIGGDIMVNINDRFDEYESYYVVNSITGEGRVLCGVPKANIM